VHRAAALLRILSVHFGQAKREYPLLATSIIWRTGGLAARPESCRIIAPRSQNPREPHRVHPDRCVGELAVTIYRGREVTGLAQDDTGVDVAFSDGQSLRRSISSSAMAVAA